MKDWVKIILVCSCVGVVFGLFLNSRSLQTLSGQSAQSTVQSQQEREREEAKRRDQQLAMTLIGTWLEDGASLPDLGWGSDKLSLRFYGDGRWAWQRDSTGLTGSLNKIGESWSGGRERDSGRWTVQDGRVYMACEEARLHTNWKAGDTYYSPVGFLGRDAVKMYSRSFTRSE